VGYSAGSTARAYAEPFNGTYTNLLNSLAFAVHRPATVSVPWVGEMYELRLAAEALIEIRDATTGKQAAPTFEYARRMRDGNSLAVLLHQLGASTNFESLRLRRGVALFWKKSQRGFDLRKSTEAIASVRSSTK
jgi:hypothetical protein